MTASAQARIPARARRRLLLLLAVAAAVTAPGCAAPLRRATTALRDTDLVDMTDRMARSLAADPVVSARTRGDEPWVVSVYRVVNHTNEIIPEREKWLYLARLRALLARSAFSRHRSVIWVIPPERWPIVAQEVDVQDDQHDPGAPAGLHLDPTHLLTARFGALTSTSARGRTDAYLCDFQLVGLSGGEIVWEDAWEVKRSVFGKTFD